MTPDTTADAPSRRRGALRHGLRLGALGGVEIVADWSLLIIFTLLALSLGAGAFPAWHPQWNAGLVWSTALAAALLFFASLLLHELSHAWVGRAAGVPVHRITLFVFGGMAHMAREPPSWKSELRMTIVGPLASFVIGFLCLALGQMLAGTAPPAGSAQAQAYLAGLSPAATVLLWLGTVNLVIAVFNLVPGFPLDGGRVLRAVAWGMTGNLVRATRLASRCGQFIAWLLMGLGLAMLFGTRFWLLGGSPAGGLWLMLIGWFLNNAALASQRETEARETLNGIDIGELMQSELTRVDAAMPLGTFVERHLLRSEQRTYPVERNGRFAGLLSVDDLRRGSLDRERPVSTVMAPAEELESISARTPAGEVLERLSRREVEQLPVLEQGRFLGLVSRAHLLRWLWLRPQALSSSLNAARSRAAPARQ